MSPLPVPDEDDPFRRLVAIMECLLSPEGCPWDRKQDHRSLKPYVIEEAYEVCEAIDDNDSQELKEELGDLGLQIVFHAALGKQAGTFNIDDVYQTICDKLIRRHPHVFGDVEANESETVLKNWEAIKRQEREEKQKQNGGERPPSALDGVPSALPALQKAYRLQGKAAKVGFDWDALKPVFDKMKEEERELEEHLLPLIGDPEEKTDKVSLTAEQKDFVEEELGDLLFSLVNLSRFLKVDPEQALQRTNRKFHQRFLYIEKQLAERGHRPDQVTLEEMDQLWEESKGHVKS